MKKKNRWQIEVPFSETVTMNIYRDNRHTKCFAFETWDDGVKEILRISDILQVPVVYKCNTMVLIHHEKMDIELMMLPF